MSGRCRTLVRRSLSVTSACFHRGGSCTNQPYVSQSFCPAMRSLSLLLLLLACRGQSAACARLVGGEVNTLVRKLTDTDRDSNSIPRVFHHVYISDSAVDANDSGVNTPAFQENVRGCKVLHPGWKFVTWNTELGLHFVATHYPQLLPAYKLYPSAIYRGAEVQLSSWLGSVFHKRDLYQRPQPLLLA